MQAYAREMPSHSKLEVIYRPAAAETASRSHGGFDNDAATLETIMSKVLGEPVPHPPKADELIGYSADRDTFHRCATTCGARATATVGPTFDRQQSI